MTEVIVFNTERTSQSFCPEADVSFQVRYPKAGEVVSIRKVVVLTLCWPAMGSTMSTDHTESRE